MVHIKHTIAQEQPQVKMNYHKDIVATFFYVGHSSIAPGTMGTLGATIIYLLLFYFYYPAWWIILGLLLLACFGNIWSGEWAEKYYQTKDPQCVVIDEVAGYFLTVLLFEPSLETAVLAFLFFRLFDITKPPPIHFFEKFPAGWGILLDDLMASVYAILAIGLIWWLSVFAIGLSWNVPHPRFW